MVLYEDKYNQPLHLIFILYSALYMTKNIIKLVLNGGRELLIKNLIIKLIRVGTKSIMKIIDYLRHILKSDGVVLKL